MSYDPHPDGSGSRRFLNRPWLDHAERILESIGVRTLLSALILLSVLPPKVFPPARDAWAFFFAVFSLELLVRLLLLARRSQRFELRLSELILLLLDFLALVSFLPFLAAHLQVLRLVRLLLLLGYWRGTLRELWILLTRRERRYQIVLVLILGAVMAFGSAVLLIEVGARHDFDANGVIDAADQSFQALLWWSFRQIQDPGNLVSQLTDARLAALSLVLTFAGLLLFSFFIGIGTTVVGELVDRSRSQPLGLSQHTVILGWTSYSGILLHELAEAYRKNSRTYRGALMAEIPMPDELASPLLRHFRFRAGEPSRTEDLDRVSIERAKRVIILGNEGADPDAAVISAILATRQRNSQVPLYPDLEHERNFSAARAAGDRGTHLVGSGSMLGYYVTQNVAYPGVLNLYRHLLQTSEGCEIYTYIFSQDERSQLRERPALDLELLQHDAQENHRTTLLGLLLAKDTEAHLEDEDLDIVLNPLRTLRRGFDHDATADHHGHDVHDDDLHDDDLHYAIDAKGHLDCQALRGLIGIALSFGELADLGTSLLPQRRFSQRTRRPQKRPDLTQGASHATDPTLEALRLEPPSRAPERILILGAGPRVPRVVMELVRFFPHLEIKVLAGPREPYTTVAHDIHNMLVEAHQEPKRVDPQAGEEFRLELTQRGATTQIAVQAVDWTDSHLLEKVGEASLQQADVILFLPSMHVAEDPDGRIALDCLHLAHLERTSKLRWPRGVHVVALLSDPAKGELLEKRLEQMSSKQTNPNGGNGAEEPGTVSYSTVSYTVISRELARHRFLMQSVFVRGLSAIYLELLSSHDQHLSRLRPNHLGIGPTTTFDVASLSTHLLHHHGLLLVGYERITKTGDTDIVVDPHDLRAGQSIPWSKVTALYVLGNSLDMASASGATTS